MLKKIGLGLVAIIAVVWIGALLNPQPAYEPYTPSEEYIAEAKVYNQQNLVSLPRGWQFGSYTHEDGTNLRWGTASPATAPKATVIFVPGYTGTLEMYAEPFNVLVDRGYKVIGFDLRGQGGSDRMLKNPEKAWVSDFSQYSDDVAGFVNYIKGQAEGPLILIGESLGGLAVTRAIGDHDLPLDGVMLQVPAMQINTGGISVGTAKFITGTMRTLGFGKHYAIGQSNWQPWTTDLSEPNYCGNNQNRIYIKDTLYTSRPELRVGGMTNDMLSEFMRSGSIVTNPDYLQNISLPVLMTTANSDTIVHSEPANQACGEMQNCQLIKMDAGHCLSFEGPAFLEELYTHLDSFVESLPTRI